ncbi:UDP-3-O-(3-hydroxymyristoyl)glucosamine N-acyltransferase [Bacteriovoracaceae bacterium]|nr:UDP-3-O-(3-hydroxymyristoyl)glucosamine N-acyltransferase [Bacteriovoracaceae bacterium]
MLISKFKSIVKLDEVLIDNDSFNIITISHSKYPIDGSVVFVSSKKQFFELMGNVATGQQIALVLETDLLPKIKSEVDLQKSFISFLATGKFLRLSIALISRYFYDQKFSQLNSIVDGRQMGTAKIHPTAQLAQNVFIGDSVHVEANVIIHSGTVIHGPAKIGKNSILHSNVSIYPYTNIGQSCRIHSNVVLGADGFGYVKDKGINHKIWHFSGVEMGNEVEVGATSTIDAGAMYPTRIGDRVKIDNSVTIGHNVLIGNDVVICGQVAIAGSCNIHDHCTLGGRAGLAPSVELKENVSIAANASLSEGAVIEENKVMAGVPAVELKEYLKTQARLRILAKREG